MIYYVLTESLPILALLIYGKNEQGGLSPGAAQGGGHFGGGDETRSRTMTEDTDFGGELIASMQEAVAIVQGEKDAARVHLPPGGIDVRALRERLGLTRPAFAQRFGLAVAAIRDWEQGLRRPDPAARVLLMVIARNPGIVSQVVAESQAA